MIPSTPCCSATCAASGVAMPLTSTGTLSPCLSASTAGQSTFAASPNAGSRSPPAPRRPSCRSPCSRRSPRPGSARPGRRRLLRTPDTRAAFRPAPRSPAAARSTAADHHHRLGRRCAPHRGQLAVGMKLSLIRDRPDHDRRKEPLAKQRDAEIQVERVDQHPRPQRDPIESRRSPPAMSEDTPGASFSFACSSYSSVLTSSARGATPARSTAGCPSGTGAAGPGATFEPTSIAPAAPSARLLVRLCAVMHGSPFSYLVQPVG